MAIMTMEQYKQFDWSNKQAIFDYVAAHLIEQGAKSHIRTSGGFSCRYRTPDGLACAFGCLIPEGLYQTDMENRPAEDVINEYFYDHATFKKNVNLIEQLQLMHDYHSWEDPFERMDMIIFARDNELEYNGGGNV